MAAKPKANLGKMPCPCCGQPVAVMKADSGTLSYKCQEADCEATGFAQAHTAAARRWLDALGTRQAPAGQAPQPVQESSSKPPAKGGFSIGGLS